MPKSKKKKPIVNKDINNKPKVTNKSGKNKKPVTAKITDGEPNTKGAKVAKSNKPEPGNNPYAGKKLVRENSKQSKMIALMQHEEGATIEELISATGWQKHSVRGVISGALKKKLGLQVTYYKEGRGKIYRVAGSR